MFAKLQGPGGAAHGDPSDQKDKPDNKKRAHHQHGDESPEDDANEEEEEAPQIFLTQQPSCIKFGNLKPYQLEALNWMIHLSEKGLNGFWLMKWGWVRALTIY
jgi:SWI/SNF-related matrix-associated actin-dependent regulator of chromatin subfamily A member 5